MNQVLILLVISACMQLHEFLRQYNAMSVTLHGNSHHAVARKSHGCLFELCFEHNCITSKSVNRRCLTSIVVIMQIRVQTPTILIFFLNFRGSWMENAA